MEIEPWNEIPRPDGYVYAHMRCRKYNRRDPKHLLRQLGCSKKMWISIPVADFPTNGDIEIPCTKQGDEYHWDPEYTMTVVDMRGSTRTMRTIVEVFLLTNRETAYTMQDISMQFSMAEGTALSVLRWLVKNHLAKKINKLQKRSWQVQSHNLISGNVKNKTHKVKDKIAYYMAKGAQAQ